MKIKGIKRKEDSYSIYEVTFEPNWIERLFGKKEETKEYKDTGGVYVYGGGHVYVNRNGDELGNSDEIGRAIDRFRRKW